MSDSFPFSSEGGFLSLFGDLLFAIAVISLLFPCLHRTLSLVDQQFLHQLVYVVEVILAVAGLCFVLLLLITQQIRVTYCKFIRPFVKERSDDLSSSYSYVGIWLKVLLCLLLVANYAVANGVKRVAMYVFGCFSCTDLNSNCPQTPEISTLVPDSMCTIGQSIKPLGVCGSEGNSMVSVGTGMTTSNETSDSTSEGTSSGTPCSCIKPCGTPCTCMKSSAVSTPLPCTEPQPLSIEPLICAPASTLPKQLEDKGTMVRIPSISIVTTTIKTLAKPADPQKRHSTTSIGLQTRPLFTSLRQRIGNIDHFSDSCEMLQPASVRVGTNIGVSCDRKPRLNSPSILPAPECSDHGSFVKRMQTNARTGLDSSQDYPRCQAAHPSFLPAPECSDHGSFIRHMHTTARYEIDGLSNGTGGFPSKRASISSKIERTYPKTFGQDTTVRQAEKTNVCEQPCQPKPIKSSESVRCGCYTPISRFTENLVIRSLPSSCHTPKSTEHESSLRTNEGVTTYGSSSGISEKSYESQKGFAPFSVDWKKSFYQSPNESKMSIEVKTTTKKPCPPTPLNCCPPTPQSCCPPPTQSCCPPTPQRCCPPTLQKCCPPTLQRCCPPPTQRYCTTTPQNPCFPSAKTSCPPFPKNPCSPFLKKTCTCSPKACENLTPDIVSGCSATPPCASQSSCCSTSTPTQCCPSSRVIRLVLEPPTDDTVFVDPVTERFSPVSSLTPTGKKCRKNKYHELSYLLQPKRTRSGKCY